MKYYRFALVFGIFFVTVATFSVALPSEGSTEPPESDLHDSGPSNGHRDLTLLEVARTPVNINSSDAVTKCSPECGTGPQLGCPKDGKCGAGQICCFDTCRKRQVCRPGSEPEEDHSKIVKRDTEYETEYEVPTNNDDVDDDYSAEYQDEGDTNSYSSDDDYE